MIELIPAHRAPSTADTVEFRHSTRRATAVAACALFAGAGLLWAGYSQASGLLAYSGALSLLSLIVLRRFLLARFRPSNWLVRLNGKGVFIQFRSYLNHRLSPGDPTVVFVPYEAIRLARICTEQKETASRDVDDQWLSHSAVETITWVEFELCVSALPLARALDVEIARRPAAGALYRDYPVRVTSDGSIQVRWSVEPGADALLVALRSRVPIGTAVDSHVDVTSLSRLPAPEQQRKLRELVRTGDTTTAVALARRVRGATLADAKAYVERLVADGAAAGVAGVAEGDTLADREAPGTAPPARDRPEP